VPRDIGGWEEGTAGDPILGGGVRMELVPRRGDAVEKIVDKDL
jgi:hypothetical protein